jgi:hypothetical protein
MRVAPTVKHRAPLPAGHRWPARTLPALVAGLMALALAALPASAQARLDRPLRVFLDCNGVSCDREYLLEEIPWVDFVRDRQSSDVHVLITAQQTGGGGRALTMEFLGRGPMEDQRLTLTDALGPTATDAETRLVIADALRVGLAPLARFTPASPTIEVVADLVTEPTPQDDPWNAWVFSFGVNGFLNGESQQSFFNGSASVSADRVTEAWKLALGGRASRNRSEFEVEDSTIVSRRDSYGAQGLAVRSLGEHWSAGVVAAWERSTFGNYDSDIVMGPAVEYDVFPYSESTRRLLTVLYAVGLRYRDYERPTIFDAATETLLVQLLNVGYDVTQTWGSADVSVEAEHFVARLDAPDSWPDPQYNLSLSGGLQVRLFRGLSGNLFGSVSMVRSQLNLPAGDLTDEEILTRQRELATDYRYFLSFGLRYRFGSIFSEVVNPRFGAFD